MAFTAVVWTDVGTLPVVQVVSVHEAISHTQETVRENPRMIKCTQVKIYCFESNSSGSPVNYVLDNNSQTRAGFPHFL